MEAINLGVEPRTGSGKGAARKVRKGGRIPAVVYRSGQDPLELTVEPSEIELAMRRTANRNTLFRFVLASTERICLVKEVQRHPVSRRLLHVDFYEVRADEPVVVKVRLDPVGRAAGTRKGGVLKIVRPWLDVRCLPGDIPTTIPVDVNELEVGQFVRIGSLEPPDGTTLLYDTNFHVVGVSGRGADEETAGGAPASAETPAAPASDNR
ncbi:MAG: 50S ribosomal protein L25 [Deltaproteobacteria bacterium]|nr:50S ribosomal protein L25 [Deltaproteobacteria bacterium]